MINLLYVLVLCSAGCLPSIISTDLVELDTMFCGEKKRESNRSYDSFQIYDPELMIILIVKFDVFK